MKDSTAVGAVFNRDPSHEVAVKNRSHCSFMATRPCGLSTLYKSLPEWKYSVEYGFNHRSWKKKSHAKLAKAQRRAIFFAPLRETCTLELSNIHVF